jgi:hypothetical protein
VTAPWGANILVKNCRFTDQNSDAIVFHTDANENTKPPTGSSITVINSRVESQGKLSFVDQKSKISVDGVERPFDER